MRRDTAAPRSNRRSCRYATDDLASHHISALVAIDVATTENGCLQIARGRHTEGVLRHTKGVTDADIEAAMAFQDVLVEVAPSDGAGRNDLAAEARCATVMHE
jgi:hypothetical protein